MVLEDIVGPDTRLYAKSEWGPAGPLWPALSFSQQGIANRFGGIYTRGRDLVITVGTGNPKDTLDPAHRQRLMSIVDVAPNIIVATGELVEPETWKRAQLTHPGRWKLSMPISAVGHLPNSRKQGMHAGNVCMVRQPHDAGKAYSCRERGS
ncbi:hypothetical protein [Bradyrhizobium yuanmingense]|uniref:hypothetical protein n=1 Tax=Bradyrhizobium yuanmingense TaxID=108015 RepID=UPI0012E3E310|nr:hypothetical protein [Bradyrhizobium yuanmingense]